MLVVELGIHDLRGRAISLRWLEHSQLYDSWSTAHYTWIVVVLLAVIVIVITFAFKYRHTVCLHVGLSCVFVSASATEVFLAHTGAIQIRLLLLL